MARKKRKRKEKPTVDPVAMLNNRVEEKLSLKVADEPKKLTRAERRAARAAGKRAAKELAEGKKVQTALESIPGKVMNPPKDDGRDEEGNKRRKKDKGHQVVCETFIVSEGDELRVYTDYHDGSAPKVLTVKKGDYVRLKVTVEV